MAADPDVFNSDESPNALQHQAATKSPGGSVADLKTRQAHALAGSLGQADLNSGNSTPDPSHGDSAMDQPRGEPLSETSQIQRQGLPAWRVTCLSVSICIGLFLSFMDTSIVATALYTIGVEFNSLTTITWIALAYILSDVGFAVLFATLSDVIGRFNAYLLAQALFLAFSFACGFAQTLNQLIAFRALQGLGGSGLYSLAMVIWPEIGPLALKKWIGGLVGLVVALAGVAGPILGGVITREISWRWIFWINPPIVLTAAVLFVISWPRANKGVRHHEPLELRQLDIKGCIFLTAGCVLPVLAFQEAAAHGNLWRNVLFIAPLAAGCGSWILLVGWELYITFITPGRFNPVFPPLLLKNRRYAAVVANSLLMGFGFFVVIYNIPLHFQIVNSKTPLGAGLSLLPMLGSVAFGSFLAGALSSGRDMLFPTLVAGSAFMAIGTGLLSTLSGSLQIEPKIYGFQVFVGLGFGLTVSSSTILANIECELKDHAVAQGIVAQARVFGGSIGLAAATAILGVKVRSQLTGIVPEENMQSLFSSTHQLSPSQLQAVRQTYTDAFNEASMVTAIISVAGFLTALLASNRGKTSLRDRVRMQEERGSERVKGLAANREMKEIAVSQPISQETGVVPTPPAYGVAPHLRINAIEQEEGPQWSPDKGTGVAEKQVSSDSSMT